MGTHASQINDPTNATLKNLHFPGYVVADITARTAIVTAVEGDLCYVQSVNNYYVYDGSNWLLVGAAFSGLTWDETNGNLDIGANDPPQADSTTKLNVMGDDGANVSSNLFAWGTSVYASLALYRARGTEASPTTVQASDILGRIFGAGYDGSAWSASRIRIDFLADENWDGSGHGTRMEFYTTPENSTTPAKAVTIDDAGRLTAEKFLSAGAATELTISGGVVTATRSYHIIDTESDNATDDLDTINGGVEGDILILRTADGGRDVVVKHGTGNIALDSGSDRTLGTTTAKIVLLFDGTSWCELSFADNG